MEEAVGKTAGRSSESNGMRLAQLAQSKGHVLAQSGHAGKTQSCMVARNG